MYSSVNNHDTSTSILSLKEIFAIIIVFSFVLYLLFPKGDIDSLIEGKIEHSNLSINYLESMLLYYPDNQKLKMILVNNYDYAGETNKALKLNQEIINSTTDKDLLLKLYKTQYLLEKTNYFRSKNKTDYEALKRRLLNYYEYTKEHRDYLFFFGEATNIDYNDLKYHSLKGLMKQRPELKDYTFEKMAYDLASTLNYKEEAYERLLSLMKYTEVDDNLQEYVLNLLIENQAYKQATDMSHDLFMSSEEEDKIIKFFYLSLYALSYDKERNPDALILLIHDYINKKSLYTEDIYIIINTLLQQNNIKAASELSYQLFQENMELFDEATTELALKALIYDSKLKLALELSTYAQQKFRKQQYLDQSIQLATWLGKVENVVALNIEGYRTYSDNKYENYLLEKTNMHNSYAILGEIYQHKVEKGNYSYVENLSRYYNYTGEVAKAETYFTSLLKRSNQKEVHHATISFSKANSHFEKALALYDSYQEQYKFNPLLHQKSIDMLISLKQFKKAYAYTKTLDRHKKLEDQRLLTDLSWLEKDFAYLRQNLWEKEKRNLLDSVGYERLMSMENRPNNEEKISYLYTKVWKKSGKNYFLLALLQKNLEKKNLDFIETTLNTLTQKEKNKLNNNIDYQIFLANYYTQTKKIDLGLHAFEKAFELNPNRIATHESYLWFLLDNQEKNQILKKSILEELILLQRNPQLQEKVAFVSVVAAMIMQDHELATRWINVLIKKSPRNREYLAVKKDLLTTEQYALFEAYEKMINNPNTQVEIGIEKKHLSKLLNVDESYFAYQWKLYKNIKSKVSVKHYKYEHKNEPTQTDTSLNFALKNSNEDLLWDFDIAMHDAKDDYLSSSLSLGYSIQNVNINIQSKYHEKTELTPRLERDALENSLSLSLQKSISQRVSFGLLYKKSAYVNQNNTSIGDAEHIQVNANYILRAGYPDIAFNTYLSHNRFDDTIAQNFSELGINATVGASRQKSINKAWKPFASLGFAINNYHNVGSSLSLGIAKSVQGKDSFDVLLNYSNGIGVVSEPIYGLNLQYRF